MIKKLFAAALFCAFIFTFQTSAKAFYPPAQNERFVIRAMQQIAAAQYTYNATDGNGNYGTFADLERVGFIDSALASGFKYGYVFAMQTVASYPNHPATFTVTATPQRYGKIGRTSFYIATSGTIRGADKHGATAAADDPIIENLCLPNEECAIGYLRGFYGAELTYQSSFGNGNYGSLSQLAAAGLIGELLARGYANGYNFTITVSRTTDQQTSFSVSAVPQVYGTSGVRSFYIATDGIIHAADKHGEPATADDPVLEY